MPRIITTNTVIRCCCCCHSRDYGDSQATGRSFPIRKHLLHSVSGLVVKSIVAIDGPRVRFAADAFLLTFWVRFGSGIVVALVLLSVSCLCFGNCACSVFVEWMRATDTELKCWGWEFGWVTYMQLI